MKTTKTLIPALLALSAGVSAHADAWNDANNPALMNGGYEYRFSQLPLQAELTNKPWSETYWATDKGSINIRWNQVNEDGFDYKLPSRFAIAQMSKEEIATLSPSEKFDIYLGRYDFPIHQDVASFANPHVTWWKGLCDGWSMTAIQFAEPKAVEVTNADGVVIPFGSSDLKGLLAYYAQMISGMEKTYVGEQCSGIGRFFHNSGCEDINPGALQVILANQIGIKKQAFVIDRDPGKQIWNQPVYGYKTEVRGSAESKAASGILVHTTLYYTDELPKSSMTPVLGTDNFHFDTMEMDYVLDLDYSGRIVGGKYEKNSEHPDLAWMPKGEIKINGDFQKLNDLLQK